MFVPIDCQHSKQSCVFIPQLLLSYILVLLIWSLNCWTFVCTDFPSCYCDIVGKFVYRNVSNRWIYNLTISNIYRRVLMHKRTRCLFLLQLFVYKQKNSDFYIIKVFILYLTKTLGKMALNLKLEISFPKHFKGKVPHMPKFQISNVARRINRTSR